MIIVTGGAGFIGSNIVKALNNKGYDDIIVVDDLSDGKKFVNLIDCDIQDYLDKNELASQLRANAAQFQTIKAIFHLGACSTTTEWDGRFMMANNYEYSKTLLHYCLHHEIPLIYASSAAVYGAKQQFIEKREHEAPLNVYGYSKFQFDQYVRRVLADATSPVIGLRYFNVYGPREQHKDNMASVAWHFYRQIQEHGVAKLFEGTDGYDAGEQRRDFIYVDDVAAINLWCYEQRPASGIYNVGTGRAQTFNDVANAVIRWYGRGKIEYIPFPEKLAGCYQSFTQADLSNLRAAGYQQPFKTVEQGVPAYLDWLEANPCE